MSPSGAYAVLHDNTGRSADDIVQTYTVNFTGYESEGTWRLEAVDSARSDVGTINGWTLSFQ